MAALVTLDELRALVETDVTDAALQMVLDAADADIVNAHGAHAGEVSERFAPGVGDARLWASRPIDTAEDVTVVETHAGPGGMTTVTLDADDYEVWEPRELVRIATGPNSGTTWAARVDVTYTPESTVSTARRRMVTVDLVRMALTWEGVGASSVGDASRTHVDYQRERRRILGRLRPGITGYMA